MTDATTEMLELVVESVDQQTPRIRALRLKRHDGGPLPIWDAGSHINLVLPSGDTRSYSLMETPADDPSKRSSTFRIGVRREEPSTGGSAFVHGLKPGDRITSSSPKNNFRLASDAGPVVLLAGGIGITPLTAMATSLSAQARVFRLIYAGRSLTDLAFLPELQSSFATSLEVHEDDKKGILDIVALMRGLNDGGQLYVCGPISMIETAIAAAKALGWPQGRLHFEIFARPTERVSKDFEVVLSRSGKRFRVASDQSILQALIAQGVDWPYDCKLGDCGVCQAAVVEGIPDHRDYYLSDKERASNKLIQVCVSRAKSEKLVLDI